MKKYIIIIIVCFVSYFAVAQDDVKEKYPFWVNITTKGGFINSHLFCNNLDNDMDVEFGYFNPGYTVGGQIGVNWGGGFGGAVEVMYTGLTQDYHITNSLFSYDKSVKIGTLDKYLLLKSVGVKGSFLEIGVKFSKILDYSETNSITVPYQNSINNFSDKERVGILMGFGINLFFTNVYSMNLGSRITYSISDYMDGEHYVIDDGLHIINNYTSYSTTNPVTVSLVLSMNFLVSNGDIKPD
ncbi:MAG: hypothetical protein Kow0068_26600 [Marinilabiliales bacterium]